MQVKSCRTGSALPAAVEFSRRGDLPISARPSPVCDFQDIFPYRSWLLGCQELWHSLHICRPRLSRLWNRDHVLCCPGLLQLQLDDGIDWICRRGGQRNGETIAGLLKLQIWSLQPNCFNDGDRQNGESQYPVFWHAEEMNVYVLAPVG